jgi:hypothetical protein
MKRRKTKRKKEDQRQPSRPAGPAHGPGVSGERGSKRKKRQNPTVGRLEEKHGVRETFSEEHAEYDRIAEPQEKHQC